MTSRVEATPQSGLGAVVGHGRRHPRGARTWSQAAGGLWLAIVDARRYRGRRRGRITCAARSAGSPLRRCRVGRRLQGRVGVLGIWLGEVNMEVEEPALWL
ncbi:pollen-specific leucine-rich repeat extensin-like protein 3 [Iris pallida]|uniref:Pollen-specific leucine-rich repeat extensin-like protein 3 n=1 Tax=Iris pallida TaxID=29817 RepID=A0AAX6II06_IRIPA|nr:pollen-specific leucine-rich repeat extensin-like protein 3 [Iris pallida]